MAISFNPSTRRVILDTASTSASEIWSRWSDWAAISDNAKYLPALRQTGGDDLGGGLSIPPYLFLLNGWRVRPMEASHLLVITGNLFVDGGGAPVVQTLGAYNVSVQYTVPVQAQAVATGGSSGPTAAQMADAVWQRAVEAGLSAEQMLRIALAALAGRSTGVGTAAENYLGLDAATVRVAAQFDAPGNRIAVAINGA